MVHSSCPDACVEHGVSWRVGPHPGCRAAPRPPRGLGGQSPHRVGVCGALGRALRFKFNFGSEQDQRRSRGVGLPGRGGLMSRAGARRTEAGKDPECRYRWTEQVGVQGLSRAWSQEGS